MTSPDENDNDHQHVSNCSGSAEGDDAGNYNENGDGNSNKKLSPTEAAIIDMMKKQNLQRVQPSPAESQQQMQQQQQQQQHRAAAQRSLGRVDGGGKKKRHAFWDTQPMPHDQPVSAADTADGDGGPLVASSYSSSSTPGGASAVSDAAAAAPVAYPEGPIVPNRPCEELRQEPYTMPAGFAWSDVDVHDADQLKELYQLLANNYVEDDDALFRFDYSAEFLLWALTPPGSLPEYLFGVRTVASGKLVAFISAVPAEVQIYRRTVPTVEINFLCVHKKLRSKRLAPVLIKEITRRVNLRGVFQAVYTAGTVLPVPVASARYHHRSLNPKKLVRVGFSRLGHRMTMARMQKLYKLPQDPVNAALRPMEAKHVPAVHELLNNYLSQFDLKILFSREEIAHWLLPRKGVVDSYVIEGKKKGEGDSNSDGAISVTDLISFYHLPSTILHHDDTLYAAYSYYNVATTTDLQSLIKDALILARKQGADVFNALDLMLNAEVLEPLKFGIGDGCLQYYIYNWACPKMRPNQVGIVLL